MRKLFCKVEYKVRLCVHDVLFLFFLFSDICA